MTVHNVRDAVRTIAAHEIDKSATGTAKLWLAELSVRLQADPYGYSVRSHLARNEKGFEFTNFKSGGEVVGWRVTWNAGRITIADVKLAVRIGELKTAKQPSNLTEDERMAVLAMRPSWVEWMAGTPAPLPASEQRILAKLRERVPESEVLLILKVLHEIDENPRAVSALFSVLAEVSDRRFADLAEYLAEGRRSARRLRDEVVPVPLLVHSLYEALSLARSASTDEIRAARRAYARQHHPDAGGATSDLSVLDESEGLLDEATRRRYDKELALREDRARLESWKSQRASA